KARCIKAKLANTRARLASRSPRVPRPDHPGTPAVISDLGPVRAPPARHAGPLPAPRMPASAVPTIAALRLHLAPLDVREHADAQHAVLSHLFARAGVTANYDRMTRAERTALLAEELAGRRPLSGVDHGLPDAARRTYEVFTTIRDAQQHFGGEV